MNVSEMDATETIWQVNWVHVNEPAPDVEIKNQFGARWVALTFSDQTGSMTFDFKEKAIVKLVGAVDLADFEQLSIEGRLCMPLYVALKIVRRMRQSDSHSLTQGEPEYDWFVVDVDHCGSQAASKMSAFASKNNACPDVHCFPPVYASLQQCIC